MKLMANFFLKKHEIKVISRPYQRIEDIGPGRAHLRDEPCCEKINMGRPSGQ